MTDMSSNLDAARDRLREQMVSAPHELLDVNGAAELLNVPASWVAAEARADRIPHVRLGRYVRYEPDELRAWWRERARGPRMREAGVR
jgi:excisionase family DNA binding protein